MTADERAKVDFSKLAKNMEDPAVLEKYKSPGEVGWATPGAGIELAPEPISSDLED
jgi:hypothetical protein